MDTDIVSTLISARTITRWRSRKNDPRHNMLLPEEEGGQLWREQFINWLLHAQTNQLLTHDRLRRLNGDNLDQWLQVVQELMAAYYLSEIQRFAITPDPGGADRHVGEFLLSKTGMTQELFCEVKTPIRRTLASNWNGNDARAITGVLKSAYKQIPKSNSPSLVIVTGKLRSPISFRSSGIMEAVYGMPYFGGTVNFTTGKCSPFQLAFRQCGFFQKDCNRHLSAVMTLEDWVGSPLMDAILRGDRSRKALQLPLHDFKYIARVYHNPYAHAPIAPGIFSDVSQWTFDTESRQIVEV